MDRQEIKQFIESTNKKDWYYHYSFGGIEVRSDLKHHKSHNLNNWKKILPAFQDCIQNMTNPSVLDVGCNMGLYAKEMESLGATVTGVDLSVDKALFFQKYVTENLGEPFNARFVKRDICKEPWVEPIDIVTMFCVLYHLEPHHDDVIKSLPDHKMIILQGNTPRLKKTHKRKSSVLAGVDGMTKFLSKHGYQTRSYHKTYEKPIVVGRK